MRPFLIEVRHTGIEDAGEMALTQHKEMIRTLPADTAQKSPAGLGGRAGRANLAGVFLNGALSDVEIQLEQFAADPSGARLLARLGQAERPGVTALTPREREVLGYITRSLSNEEIAARLVISLGTAKRHVHHIFEKLGVHNRTQAAARARELGIA
jgi:ATP/maltotriose-dependent transcriptional regulator MalT